MKIKPLWMKEASFFVLFSQHKISLLSQEFFFKAPYFFYKRGIFLEGKFLAFALFSC